MPWKECHVMDERLRFVARRLEGETMTALCAEFGISRQSESMIVALTEEYHPPLLGNHAAVSTGAPMPSVHTIAAKI